MKTQMKFLLFLLFFTSSTLLATAQEEMPSVAGVKLGESYSTCKVKLDKRFNGGKESYPITANELTYYNVTFADEYFDYVDFYFQTDGTVTRLSCIVFTKSFDLADVEYAKEQRDRLFKSYSDKYEVRWDGVDKNDFKYYVLGHNPIKPEEGLIVIGITKGKNNKGEMKLWTKVSYGPVLLINPTDEI